ncbi:MAG: flagellar export chaperone FlgN [Agathobacter sp.]|nr:flagellar export chaperone FlgN [Agathobacter sp.]
MEQTYVDIMIQSLEKKIKVLEEIKKQNLQQKALLEDENAEADAFDATVESKAALIEQIMQLDSGFDKLFERVKDELNNNQEAYGEKIKKMQSLIRKITDLSMEVQTQEARNKDLMTRKFVMVRERAKAVRTNTKAASQYYQNMMQLNVIDPQFMDNKK